MAAPFDELVLAGPPLDRAADLRFETGVIPRLLGEPGTRVLDVHEMRVPTVGAPEIALALRHPEASDEERDLVLLGRLGGGHVLAALQHGEGGTPLRAVADLLPPDQASLAATAVALDNWHRTHPRGPRCGGPTEIAQAGWVRRCPADESWHHPRTDPAVIMAVTDPDDRLLLARNAGWPPGRMSVLAGFVEPGETLAAAVAREVHEEVGLEVSDVRYRADQPWPFPASLMVGFTARAASARLAPDGVEIVEARWFTRDELAAAFESGELYRPRAVSISARLVEEWYGGELCERSDPAAVGGR